MLLLNETITDWDSAYAGLVPYGAPRCEVYARGRGARTLRGTPTQPTRSGEPSLGAQLESLDLSECAKLSDDAVLAVAQNCRNLNRLYLNALAQLSDVSLLALAEGDQICSKADQGWKGRGLAREEATTTKMRHRLLNEAKMEDLHQQHQALAMAEDNRVLALSFLELNGCAGITDAGLETLVGSRHGETLRLLELNGCARVSDVGARALGRCRRLMFLELGWCFALSDAGVAAIAEECRDLSAINLSGNPLLTSQSVVVLNQHCARLAAVNVFGCRRMVAVGSMQNKDAKAYLHGNGNCSETSPKVVAKQWLLKRALDVDEPELVLDSKRSEDSEDSGASLTGSQSMDVALVGLAVALCVGGVVVLVIG